VSFAFVSSRLSSGLSSGLAAILLAHGAQPAPPGTVALWLGGDVHLDATGSAVLGAIPPLVEGAVGIVNLEGPIDPRRPLPARPAAGQGLRLINPPGAAAWLEAAGVRVATIANNHAGDAGARGGAATARALRSGGVLPAGGDAGVAILAAGGIRVAIAAWNLDGDRLPPSLTAELGRARRAGDALVATFHVTGPPSYLPGPVVRRAVDAALAAGASVVAVHGSHALGRVERRGRAVIAWGLGNLAFACDCTQEGEAILLRVAVSAAGAGRATVIPIAAGLRGAPVTAARDAAGILDLLAALGSSPLDRAADRASF
jgi:poly-gamma-glutamate capsule biosynthesis protein CapA/YwtB (metallophosphatase superfamily)